MNRPRPADMDLSIIIVSWNTRDLLAHCLSSIFTHPPPGKFEVIVVDNASVDGTAAMVRERFPWVRLMAMERNLGFAAANNRAIETGQGRYLLLLNPDTIVQSGALIALVDFMDKTPDAGAAGSLLLNSDGTLQISCYPVPTLGRELWRLFHLDRLSPRAVYPMADWAADVPRAVDTIQGASFMVRRDVLHRTGSLDESFFMYSEEVDWCLRIRSAGWKIYWVPDSRVVHHGGQSSSQVQSKMFLQLYRGKLTFFRKHYGRISGLLYKGELFIAAIARIILTPIACLLAPQKCGEYTTLARQYGRLVISLPKM